MEQQEQTGAYRDGAQATQAPEYQKAPYTVDTDAALQHRKKAQTGMILGIIGCVLVFYPVLSVVAIVLGALALSCKSEASRIAQQAGIRESGMNTAGFVTGLVAVIGGALLTLLYVIGLILFVALFRVALTELDGASIQSFFGYMESMM